MANGQFQQYPFVPQKQQFIPPGTTDFASNALVALLLGIKAKADENRRLQHLGLAQKEMAEAQQERSLEKQLRQTQLKTAQAQQQLLEEEFLPESLATRQMGRIAATKGEEVKIAEAGEFLSPEARENRRQLGAYAVKSQDKQLQLIDRQISEADSRLSTLDESLKTDLSIKQNSLNKMIEELDIIVKTKSHVIGMSSVEFTKARQSILEMGRQLEKSKLEIDFLKRTQDARIKDFNTKVNMAKDEADLARIKLDFQRKYGEDLMKLTIAEKQVNNLKIAADAVESNLKGELAYAKATGGIPDLPDFTEFRQIENGILNNTQIFIDRATKAIDSYVQSSTRQLTEQNRKAYEDKIANILNRYIPLVIDNSGDPHNFIDAVLIEAESKKPQFVINPKITFPLPPRKPLFEQVLDKLKLYTPQSSSMPTKLELMDMAYEEFIANVKNKDNTALTEWKERWTPYFNDAEIETIIKRPPKLLRTR